MTLRTSWLRTSRGRPCPCAGGEAVVAAARREFGVEEFGDAAAFARAGRCPRLMLADDDALGRLSGTSGTPFSAFAMNAIQIGSAATPPVSLVPERPRLVEADPGDADHRRIEAAEPGVDVVVGGAGLAGEVLPAELHGARRRCRRGPRRAACVVMMKALRGSIARSASSPATAARPCDSTLPRASTTRAMR